MQGTSVVWENDDDMISKGGISLQKELRKLDRTLPALNSPQRRFVLGIVHGVGTAVGATIITAVLIYGIISTLHALGLDDVMNAVGLKV